MHMHALLHTANALSVAAIGASPVPITPVNLVGATAAGVTWAGTRERGTNALSKIGQHRSASRSRELSCVARLGRMFADLRALPAGWDGYGAETISTAIVDVAAQILGFALAHRSPAMLPHLAPIADGGLQAEWHTKGERFEFYFEADGEIAAWTESRTTGAEYEANGIDAVRLLMGWLVKVDRELKS